MMAYCTLVCFPACLLYFKINSAEVDVNVHPTKHEVRFQQPRLVHDFFTSQLTHALNTKTAMNTEHEDEFAAYSSSRISEPYPSMNPLETIGDTLILSKEYSEMDVVSVLREKQSSGDSNINFKRDEKGSSVELGLDHTRLKIINSLPRLETEANWVILNNHYILVFMQQQPYIVDIVGFQRQWLQSQLLQLALPLESRPLLVPISYPIPKKSADEVIELQHCLEQLGIQTKVSNDVIYKSAVYQLEFLIWIYGFL